MSWFGPKLEPGERVVIRRPDRRDGTFWQGLMAVLLVVELVVFVAMHEAFGIGRRGTGVLLFAVFALVAFAATRWRLIVTDRRLLHRRGLFLSRIEEIRLDEIEDVRSEMGAFAERIVIRARCRETVVAMVGVDPAPVVAAIRGAAEATS